MVLTHTNGSLWTARSSSTKPHCRSNEVSFLPKLTACMSRIGGRSHTLLNLSHKAGRFLRMSSMVLLILSCPTKPTIGVSMRDKKSPAGHGTGGVGLIGDLQGMFAASTSHEIKRCYK